MLVEGKVNLLLYVDADWTRYFFQVPGSRTEQLVYKKYIYDQGDYPEIRENKHCQQQLYIQLMCEGISLDEIKNVSYNKESLVKFFIRYSKCMEADYVNYTEKENRTLYSINISPGLNIGNLKLVDINGGEIFVDYDTKLSFRIGIDIEMLLPFNHNKWGIIFEPSFQSFKATSDAPYRKAVMDYKSLDLHIGGRRYFVIGDKTDLFLTGALVISTPLNSTFTLNDLQIFKINIMAPNVNFGLGLRIKRKVGFEIKYGLNRDFMFPHPYLKSEYSTLTAILSYNFM